MKKRFFRSLEKFVLPIIGLCLVAGSAHAASDKERVASVKVVVSEFIDGTTRVSAEEVIEMIGSQADLVVIDSRIADDLLQGYIEGAISLPNTDTNCESLATEIPTLDTPALFYCNGIKCDRSSKAIKIALECGVSKLYWFRGGIEEWKNKEYPLVR